MKQIIGIGTVVLAACALSWAQTEAPKSTETKAAAQTETKTEGGTQVEKMATAAGIDNREPVGEAKSFDESAGKVFCWMKVATKDAPTTIKHVWFLDGKQVAEVPLKINYPSMRTWSSKTIAPGKWKVEAADSAGVTLGVVEFTVTSGASSVAPAEKKR